MTTRRELLTTLAACALAAPLASFAQQQPAKIARIGFLGSASGKTDTHYYRALVDGLREHGLVEGKNIAFEWRFAEGNYERLPALAQELVQLNVDIIVVNGTPAVRAAKQATATIPIVMAVVGADPVTNGFAAGLAHPDGNITGVCLSVTDVSAKQLELLRTLSPKWSRIAVLTSSANSFHTQVLDEFQAAAAILHVKVLAYEAHDSIAIDTAFAAMARAHAQAVVVAPDPFYRQQSRQLAELTKRYRLPSMLATRELVEAGGLMSYGQNYVEHFQRAAAYVDKILKGARPGDLPIELPTRFELVVNMDTAKALGIKIPNSILVRAESVIE